MKKILLVAGTRPNFIKLAPLYHSLKKANIAIKICHTGQHYDKNMSGVFWETLNLPKPDYNLNIRGLSVPEIIGKTTIELGNLLMSDKFDMIIVFGDVNATVGGAIAATQLRIPTMHVESGLRSFDRNMPEENNRIITDHISDFLMVSEESGMRNLKNEGISDNKIFFVGNIMIECLLMTKKKWENIIFPKEIQSFINSDKFVVSTFHRPENVDKEIHLNKIVNILIELSKITKVIFPLHPRTKKNLKKYNLFKNLLNENIIVTEPLDYFTFLKLVASSYFVITDSGGIQEETSFLNIPCATFRKNTERPITIEIGTNRLFSIDNKQAVNDVLLHVAKKLNSKVPSIPAWDSNVSNRIVKIIKNKIPTENK